MLGSSSSSFQIAVVMICENIEDKHTANCGLSFACSNCYTNASLQTTVMLNLMALVSLVSDGTVSLKGNPSYGA